MSLPRPPDGKSPPPSTSDRRPDSTPGSGTPPAESAALFEAPTVPPLSPTTNLGKELETADPPSHYYSKLSPGQERHPPYDFLSPPQQPDELGRLAHYRVLRLLGTGGMGMVFHAEDTLLLRPVALKVIKPAMLENPSARDRFLREARTAAAVVHDHVVPIYHVGEDRGTLFLAMPLLQGESLEARLRRQAPLPLPEVLRIGRETAAGLAAAHAQGLVHRDIKPAKLWLEGKAGRVRVLDFGLARRRDDGDKLTVTGAVMIGTPSYMAPEQAGGKKVDARADLFSLVCRQSSFDG